MKISKMQMKMEKGKIGKIFLKAKTRTKEKNGVGK